MPSRLLAPLGPEDGPSDTHAGHGCSHLAVDSIQEQLDAGASSRDVGPQPQDHERPSPISGGGGPWRAFVHRESQGHVGSPDLHALSVAYRELDEDARQALKELGEAATRAHRENPSGSAFGPRRPSSARIGSLPAGAVAEALGGAAPSPGANFSLSEVAVQGSAGGVDLANALRIATSHARAFSKVSLGRLRACRDALQTFAVEGIASARDRFEAMLSGASPWRVPLAAVPDRHMSLFEVRSQARELAETVVAWTAGSRAAHGKVAREAGAALETDWAHQTDVIEHARCDPIPPVASDASAKPSMCCVAGRCVHLGSGAKLKGFRMRFLKALAHLLPKDHPEMVSGLKGGYIFVMLSGSAQGNVPGEGGAGDSEGPPSERHLFHIALMYLSPWRPTLQRMRILSETSSR